ncbi:MAG: DUF4249 family protein [Cyclobacteriaceae bacterium]|nr:DUF4249 family protein [Cyclobacteriaceae bacterium]
MKKIIFQLFLILCTGSCLTPIEINTLNVGGTIVIAGQVSPLKDRSSIQIGSASEDERLPVPISGAEVKLLDSDGNRYYYIENSSFEGTYTLENTTAVPGRTYHIEVTLPTGSVYTSIPETMPISVGTLSTNFDVVAEEFIDAEGTLSQLDFIKIFANSQFPVGSSMSHFRWSVEETYLLSPTDFPDPFGSIPPPCFISQNADPQRVTLLDLTTTAITQVNQKLIASRIVDFSFLERHYFTSYQTALSNNAFEYWSKVNILANQVGSIFDTPPAKIKGNIINVSNGKEEVLGYFQAVNESYDRFFTLPYLLPIKIQVRKCDFTGSFNSLDYPPRCINCLSVRNSSYSRPDWF